jgi:predicted DsbA family dithiol-disulfide isomerase
MVKSSKKHRSKSYRKPHSRSGQNKILPWALGACAILIIILMVYNSLRKPGTEEPGSRSYEALFGVRGTSLSIGETAYQYPDPGNIGSGLKLLPALGEEDAPVTLFEFSDIFCGHCRAFALEHLEGIIEEYVDTGKVRYVDHYFGFPNALQYGAVDAMFCAAEQGHYFEFKHTLMQAVEINALDVSRAARVSGLDMQLYKQCMDSGRYKAALQEMLYDDNMGVSATPTFFINGEQVTGNRPDEIRQLIEQALQNAE